MSIIFFGSSNFSIPALKSCMKGPWKVLMTITTPDKKKGRGMKLSPTPVKQFCQENGIPCESPDKLKDPELLERVKKMGPEYFVVSSYGKFIPSLWLDIPSKLSLNVHPSLLPKYRGAAPINWAILNQDRETGISIMEVTSELDAGDVFYQKSYPLDQTVDAEALSRDLAEKSFGALQDVFKKIQDGKLKRTPQDHDKQCYARKLEKEDAVICWEDSAEKISAQVRGLLPWPVAKSCLDDVPFQVLKATAQPSSSSEAKPGEVIEVNKEGYIRVKTGAGELWVREVKPQGKKTMSALDFAHGRRLKPGMKFTSPAVKDHPAS